MAEAAGRVGQGCGDSVKPVKPDGAARRLRPARAVRLIARALAILVVLAGADLEGIALGTRTSLVWLALRVRAARALGACVLRLIALPAVARTVPPLAIVGLAVVVRGTPRAAAIGRRAARAPMAVGVWRFHRWRV